MPRDRFVSRPLIHDMRRREALTTTSLGIEPQPRHHGLPQAPPGDHSMTSPDDARSLSITRLLNRAVEGDHEAAAAAWALVHAEVHRIATSLVAGESATPTLQPSVLVNEAYLRLFGAGESTWNDQRHFLNVVARSMSNYLVDRARSRRAVKRGGDRRRLPLTIAVGELANFATSHSDSGDLASEALDALAQAEPEVAEIARLRFILGLTVEQTADVCGVASRTVKKRWAFARAWMLRYFASHGWTIDDVVLSDD